jgi:excisionase family DNA binding protein
MKYDLTLNDVSQLLNKSRRTITRYIKDGKLKPKKKGNQYWFNESEVERLSPDAPRQMASQDKIIEILQKELEEKGNVIKELLERQRELNLMLNKEQNRNLLLENKAKDKGVIRGFIDRLFKRK